MLSEVFSKAMCGGTNANRLVCVWPLPRHKARKQATTSKLLSRAAETKSKRANMYHVPLRHCSVRSTSSTRRLSRAGAAKVRIEFQAPYQTLLQVQIAK